ncbi:MAG TPA: hypothetical protein VNT99_20460, partial [Methylomirabilota bacterium]|nr:hypothetical protein [Methylomirabilota bacterium]
MKTRRVTVLALVILEAFLGGCAAPPKSVSRRVTAETLLSLQHGISLIEVGQRLDAKSWHEFTAQRDGHVIRCVSYRFERSGGNYSRFFVFTNEMLAKICVPPKIEFERVAGDGKSVPYERPKYGDPEVRMESVLSASDLTGRGLIESIPTFPPQQKSEPMNVLPGLIVTAPFLLMSAGEYRYEATLLAERFDPRQVKIGTRVEDIEAVFGEAVLIESPDDAREFRYYGSTIRGVNMIAWMLVVYEKGAAIRVFTNHFFDRSKVLDFERRR